MIGRTGLLLAFKEAGLKSALASMLMAAVVGSALAQGQTAQYPIKPIRMIVPFTPGGSGDTLARTFGAKLTEAWGQQLVVENRGGAGGTIGMEAAKQMPPDGYNFVLISSSQAASHAIYPNIRYDITKDFLPISLTVNTPMMLVAHPRFGVGTVAEVIAKARREPGKLSYASCGVGTTHHLAMEALKFHTNVNIVHVPYRGCSPALADLIAGQVDLAVLTASAAIPMVRANRIQAIAVTGKRRAQASPEVSTIAESGVPELKNFDVGLWLGFMAPLGTPPEIVAKFDSELRRIVMLPDVQAKFTGAGLEPILGDAKELMTVLSSDIVQFEKIVDYAKITPN